MKNLTFLLLFLFHISLTAQGVGFDNQAYSKIPDAKIESLGFIQPISQSLKKYAPRVLLQNGNSCVGFAMAYSAMSIMHNYKLGITSEMTKQFLSFDPYFLYSVSQEKNNNKICGNTTVMSLAISNLKIVGCKKFFMTPTLDCDNKAKKNQYWSSIPYKLKSYKKISYDNLKNQTKFVALAKDNLLAGKPIVVGLTYTNSWANKGFGDGTVSSNGLWEPKHYDKKLGGHAVTIIGYNDDKFGGSFEIMNSWGTNFGDNGFMWIKYADIIKVLNRAFIMEIYDYNKESQCKMGNCKNNYGFIKNKGYIIESNFINGNPDGYCIIINDKSTLLQKYKNGNLHGKGYIYINEEKKFYSIKSRNGELIKVNELGFAEIEPSEDEKLFEIFISNRVGEENISNKGIDDITYKKFTEIYGN